MISLTLSGYSFRLNMILVSLLIFCVFSPQAEGQRKKKLKKFDATSHALNRLAFGPTTGQVPEVGVKGWEKWAEIQLNPESIDDDETQKMIDQKCPSLKATLSRLQTWRRLKNKERQKEKRRVKTELTDSVLLRAVYSKRQFNEVMVEFWRNHFNVDINKVPFLATHYEENVLRKHAFGKFDEFLLATAKHPAMLLYLDNRVSRRGNINENYAREIMELHTLGVDNGYTQQDVIELARVLTGWTSGWKGKKEYRQFFNAGAHDNGPATVVGLKLDGRGGEADGEKVIRYLAHHPNTARFISTKLCRYLVNDSPPETLIDKVSKVFQETGGDLREVYRAIIFSPEFIDGDNYRVKFKTPFEYLISSLRATDARIKSTKQLQRTLNLMGQPIYECVEPTGYYDQAETWLDPGVMIYRWNFALNLVQVKVKGVTIGEKFVDKVLKRRSQKSRAKYVILMVMPGSKDPSTETLVSRAKDIRVMVAAAMGSPGFQQQ